MSTETKQILTTRIKSFLWRLGSMIGVTVLAFLAENAELFNLPIWGIGLIGLISGELTKYLNTAPTKSL